LRPVSKNATGAPLKQLDASRRDWIEEIANPVILTLLVEKRMEFLP
jgi:hypothetical protein